MKAFAFCLIFIAILVCDVSGVKVGALIPKCQYYYFSLHSQTDEQKLQDQVYIISGVFGGVTLILCLMILGLAYSITKSDY